MLKFESLRYLYKPAHYCSGFWRQNRSFKVVKIGNTSNLEEQNSNKDF